MDNVLNSTWTMNTTITLGDGAVVQSRNPTMTSPGLSAHALPKFNINEVARESSNDQVRVRNGSITLTLTRSRLRSRLCLRSRLLSRLL